MHRERGSQNTMRKNGLISDNFSKTDQKWARRGSNPRPTGYEPDAPPLSYGPAAESS